MKKLILLISLVLSTQFIHSDQPLKQMVICKPIANLLVTPSLNFDFNLHEQVFKNLPLESLNYLKTLPLQNQNPNLDSQLLFGEKILCLNEEGNWLKIQTLEQFDINNKNEKTYITGYIQKDQAIETDTFSENNLIVHSNNARVYSIDNPQELMQLSIGTKLQGIKIDDEWCKINLLNGQYGKIHNTDITFISDLKNKTITEVRNNLVKTAKSFLGFPYCWGGSSSYNPLAEYTSSIDCSTYIMLIFLINEIEIARNSNSQFNQCKKIESKNLKAGDLIFFGNPAKTNRIVHVLMYLGNDQIIECNCPKGVLITNSLEKLGKHISEIQYGENCKGKTVYFGSLLD